MDIKLHFTEKGAGEPLILLHGNGESSEYFIHQIGYFSSKYRVIAVDTRGHGRSPRGSAAFTIRQFAEENLQVTLALSLHAPNDEVRKTLMPVANSFALKDVLDACHYYFEKTG